MKYKINNNYLTILFYLIFQKQPNVDRPAVRQVFRRSFHIRAGLKLLFYWRQLRI